MLILLKDKVTHDQLDKAGDDLDGYIKFVADIDRGFLTIGGLRHVDGEQLLLQEGSLQVNLWGGGYDRETSAVDYNSMINIRPRDNNMGREVISTEIRSKINVVLRDILGVEV